MGLPLTCNLHCRLAENGSLHQKRLAVQVNNRPSMPNQQQAPRPPGRDPKQREDFYANIGEAIRTLKAEIPRLFQEDLTCGFFPLRSDCHYLDSRQLEKYILSQPSENFAIVRPSQLEIAIKVKISRTL